MAIMSNGGRGRKRPRIYFFIYFCYPANLSELYEKCMGPARQTSVIAFIAGGMKGETENKISLRKAVGGGDSILFQINVF